MRIAMIENTAPPATKKYLTQGFMPVRSAALLAICLVCIMIRPAQANSVAKIPSPASKTRTPGPGATSNTAPNTVTPPPMNPIIKRHAIRPAGVFLIQLRNFILFYSLAIGKDGQKARLAARLTQWRIDIHPDNPVTQIKAEKPEEVATISPIEGD